MTDGVRIVGLACLAISLCVSVLVVPDDAFLIKTLAIGLCTLAGVPAIAMAVRVLRRK